MSEVVPSPTGKVGELILAGIDRSVATRWEPALDRARKLEGHEIDVQIKELRRVFRKELGVAGAASGGVGAVPGMLGPAVAAGLAETTWTTMRLADLILTIAAVHGHDQATIEERRMWVLAILAYGAGASDAFGKLAAKMGLGLGKRATAAIPTASLRAINRAIGTTIVTKNGTVRGVVVLGKALPMGIGAGLGMGLNAALVHQVCRHSDSFFRQLGPIVVDDGSAAADLGEMEDFGE